MPLLFLRRRACGIAMKSVLATLLLAATAAAHEFRAGDITIDHPWSRAIAARAPTAAGYLTIRNMGTREDKLIGAQTPMANATELHEMSVVDNIMRMRPIDGGIVIPPGAEVQLAPNGRHLMLIGPKEGFVQGARVPLTLVFERAGRVDVELAIQAMGARAAESHRPVECDKQAEHHGEVERDGRTDHCDQAKN
jgi:copper(I)-binding protein